MYSVYAHPISQKRWESLKMLSGTQQQGFTSFLEVWTCCTSPGYLYENIAW